MVTKKSVAIYLAAVFLAGLMAGAVAGFGLGKRKAFAPPRPQAMAAHIFGGLKSKLHLTPEQAQKIEPLVKEAAAELEAAHAATADRITEIFQKLNQRQAQFLTPDQKVLLEKMERERQEFFRKACQRPFGPPRPRPGPPPNTHF